MTTYYVSTDGSDNDSGSSSSPWRTISRAMKADLDHGDEVVVRSGTYRESVTIKQDGITLRSEKPGGAKIDVPSDESLGIHINANYVTIDGFEVTGSSGSGISGKYVHHIELIDNIVHDNVSNGIFLGLSDYLLLEGNEVYGNAAQGPSSGIHIKGAYAVGGSDGDGGYRIIIRDNEVYENVTKFGPRTDGNGISLDDFRNTQMSSLPSYEYETLVEDNIIYSNYGAGIQLAWSDYATIRDNISFHNNTGDTGLWDGELQNMGSSNNRFIGNIAVTDSRSPAISNVSFSGDPMNENVTWSDNITWNGTKGADSVHANAGNSEPSDDHNWLGVDPKFVDAPDDFDLRSDSPLHGGGLGADGAGSLRGDSGNNELYGGAGSDRLHGFRGRDYLSGGDGRDLLLGGKGKDELVGGDDGDVFAFSSTTHAGLGSSRDVIRDFSRADGDQIDLSEIDANTDASGNQAFSFIGTQGFSGTAGQLRYLNGVLAGDVDGDKWADFQIEIANDPSLGSGDFLL
jgi:Ca2+-binding RTX toxin-like protein